MVLIIIIWFLLLVRFLEFFNSGQSNFRNNSILPFQVNKLILMGRSALVNHAINLRISHTVFSISLLESLTFFKTNSYVLSYHYMGTRLTYNFWRKGRYHKDGEDYCWAYLREKYPKILVEVLNFIFTSYYQLFLIYLFVALIKFGRERRFIAADYAVLALGIVLFIG